MLKYHIQTIEVGSGGASSISFNSIPQIYDDLVLVLSGRSNSSGQPSILYRFNNSSSGYSSRILAGYTSGVTTGVPTTLNSVNAGGDWGRLDYEGFNYSASTANTFSNIEFRIPNYKSNSAKAGSADIAVEDVSASPLRWWLSIVASLWTGTQPINSVSFALHQGSFAQYSSASLYGIKRGSDGKTDVAAGGVITQSGGYTYHTFTSSGTLVVKEDLQVEALLVAGGGSGGAGYSGGGGAGGVLYMASQVIPKGSNAVVVGSGGALYSSGNNSYVGNAVAIGGGRGGNGSSAGVAGGSGGGGGGQRAFNQPGGAGVIGQGFAGGFGGPTTDGNERSAGGGGAGGVGGNWQSSSGGVGGIGTNSYSAWATATSTGVSGYYAGGGGGGSWFASGGAGGLGGGGTGQSSAGAANTGGGGGGAPNYNPAFAGGSGVVIIRYLTPA
jgi:hypothetical protein